MGRPRLHSDDTILDAARDLVLRSGARSTTLNAIAKASGAPKGSVYHRFASLNDLLAAMWIRAVRRAQGAFLEAVDEPNPTAAAVAAALSLHDFAKREPADARLLASLRREDLIEGIEAPALRRELAELNEPVQRAIAALARRLYGNASAANVERTVCAVVDLPLGAIRRHLIAGSTPPRTLRGQLEAAVRAALLA
jgi:AcrR family transcriptional regulator